MGSLELGILAVKLYSHYYVVFGKPPAELERRDSFVNKYFECIYMSSDV